MVDRTRRRRAPRAIARHLAVSQWCGQPVSIGAVRRATRGEGRCQRSSQRLFSLTLGEPREISRTSWSGSVAVQGGQGVDVAMAGADRALAARSCPAAFLRRALQTVGNVQVGSWVSLGPFEMGPHLRSLGQVLVLRGARRGAERSRVWSSTSLMVCAASDSRTAFLATA